MPSDHIYKVVEELPVFSDCEGIADRNKKQNCSTEKVNEYIYKNLKYPAIARENGVQGAVTVSFIVEKDGSTSNHKIIRNIGAGCGDEAVRLIEKMGKWIPAKNRREAVRCEVKQVVRFEIPEFVDQRIESTPKTENNVPTSSAPVKEKKFKVVEEMPSFPGCEGLSVVKKRQQCAQKKMLEFIYKNLKYPTEARKNGVEGTVVITYVVEKDGTINDAKILRDIGDGCGEEALRIVNSMPKWNPGIQKGKPVNVQFNIPIRFKLEYSNKKIKELQKQARRSKN